MLYPCRFPRAPPLSRPPAAESPCPEALVAVIAALLACFDATARLFARPRCLLLSLALAGRLEVVGKVERDPTLVMGYDDGKKCRPFAIHTASLRGDSLATLLARSLCVQPAALRAFRFGSLPRRLHGSNPTSPTAQWLR